MLRKRLGDESREIQIDGVGAVIMERSRRARRIVIYILPFRGIRVAVPAKESFKEAERFIFAKINWIRRRQAEMLEYEKRQKSLQERFNGIDRAEAKKALGSRLRELALKHGFTYGKVTIRKQKTRWGSCTLKGDINLNVNLMGLPDELRDYVLLHELSHTRVHNHSKAFWTELEKYVHNARAVAKKLRETGLELV